MKNPYPDGHPMNDHPDPTDTEEMRVNDPTNIESTIDNETYAAFKRLQPVMNTIHEVISQFPDGLPSGHLYAMVMGSMSYNDYTDLIGLMIKAGGITQSGFVLRVVK